MQIKDCKYEVPCMRPGAIVILVALLVSPGAAWAFSPKAAGQVKLGIEHFEAGDYAAAAEAFARADAARPDDARIAFDRGCAYAARGDEADAIEWFRRAALSENPQLAARSQYNLGCLNVDKVKALFGEKPEEAEEETRRQGVELLETAVGHFRDAARLDPRHLDARHNIEATRLWITHMKEAWRSRDAQQQRDKLELPSYLKMLDQRQRTVRLTARGLSKEAKSPKRRQDAFVASKAQRQLAEEIGPLRAKIEAALQQTAPKADPQQSAPQADPQQAARLLGGLADNAGQAMIAAAERLAADTPGDAVDIQAEAIEKLDEVYMVAAPYAMLVQTAVERQQALVDQSKQETDPAPDAPAAEPAESVWNQRFVTGYSEMIRAKAQQGLKNMPQREEAMEDESAEDDRPVAGPPLPPVPPGADESAAEPADPAEAMKQQREALRKAMLNAVQYAPKVRALTIKATNHLEDDDPAAALPMQEEALELLKKMLPKQPKDQNQQQDQQKQDQNQDKKDDENKKEQDKKEQDGKDQHQKEKDQDGKDQQQQKEPRDLSKQQADAVLRKARQRQQEKRKLEKMLQQYLYRPGKVEKDW